MSPMKRGRAALVGGAEFDAGEVAKVDRKPVDVLHDDAAELLGRGEAGARENREFAVRPFDAARGNFDILLAQRRLDVLHGEVLRNQPQAVDPDAHRIAALAENANFRDAGQVLQLVLDESRGVIGQLEGRMTVAQQRHVHDGLRVGLHFRDDGLFRLCGQLLAHAPDAVAHVAGRGVGVRPEAEANLDLAFFRPAAR